MVIKEEVLKEIVKKTIEKYLAESKKDDISNIVFVAFGNDKFDINKARPVDFNSSFASLNNKPTGGVWGSPLTSKNGWADWCNSNNFRINLLSKHFLFSISPTAKIYVLDTLEDLKKISNVPNTFGDKSINFKQLYENGYDGIFVTANAVSNLRYVGKGYAGLDTWDVESICIFNPEVIVPIEEDAFEKAKINKYGEPYKDYYDDEDDFWTDSRKSLQMQSDFDRYSNQNVNKDMSQLFKGKHPGILAQKHGNSKDSKLARKFNGTVQSGLS